MSLGGLATHLSSIPHWAGTILTEPSFDLADAPAVQANRRRAPPSSPRSTTVARGSGR